MASSAILAWDGSDFLGRVTSKQKGSTTRLPVILIEARSVASLGRGGGGGPPGIRGRGDFQTKGDPSESFQIRRSRGFASPPRAASKYPASISCILAIHRFSTSGTAKVSVASIFLRTRSFATGEALG